MRNAIYGSAVCLVLVAAAANAQYPEKSIRFMMPYPPGGSIDIAGRAVAQKLAEALGRQIIVDNRTGAGGTIGTETAAHAAPDGYTILMGGTGTLALSPNLQKNLPYDPVRDFAPITDLVSTPYVLVVHPSFAAHSAKELVEMAKARPGQINYASGGIGSAPHLAAEVFRSMASINLVHVPYKGSTPAITEVLAGQVPFIFTGIPSVLSYIKAGRLRAIGVTSATRTTALPDVPTIADTGVPGYDVSPWFGVLAPARTPRAIVMKLNDEIVKVLKSAAIRERFAVEGVEPIGDSPEHFAAYIKSELAKWGKVLKESGIHGD